MLHKARAETDKCHPFSEHWRVDQSHATADVCLGKIHTKILICKNFQIAIISFSTTVVFLRLLWQSVRKRMFVLKKKERKKEIETNWWRQSDCSYSLCASLLHHGYKRWSCERWGPAGGEPLQWGQVSCRTSGAAAPQDELAAVGRKGLSGTFLRVGDTSSSSDGRRDRVAVAVAAASRLRVSNLNVTSDELAGVSFADEDFQQPQFGLDMLVFAVLLCQRGAVLFLHVPTGTAQQTPSHV